jgi:hypothetical protein
MKTFAFSIILLAILSKYTCSQFEELNSGVTSELTSSSNCLSGNHYFQGWACGVNGVVIRSTGASSIWLNLSGHGIPTDVSLDNICGLDSNNAIVCGHLNSNTWVWKTTNGGQNWLQVFNQPNGRINAVWMINYVQGFMQGNPVGARWSLWKTINGGVNWDSSGLNLPQANNELGWPNSLSMPMFEGYPSSDSNKIWFGTNNARIYYSSDYGAHWMAQLTAPEQNSVCIMFGLGGTLYAGGSTFALKTTNYGTNWTLDTVPGSGYITGITCLIAMFVLTRGDTIYERYQNNWYPHYHSPSGVYKYVDNKGLGNWVDHYAVGSNGGITFMCVGEGVQKISSEIPNMFSLSQNYPNPFNPVTKIKFDVPLDSRLRGNDNVTLKIYDVLGREITTLVNEKLSPGTYEIEWDASNYPSGVYFYKLITADYTETRKMVLVK